MILQARKDFMVFKQHVILWSDLLADFLYARSINVFTTEENEAA